MKKKRIYETELLEMIGKTYKETGCCPYERLEDVREWIAGKLKLTSPKPKNFNPWFDKTDEIDKMLVATFSHPDSERTI